MDRKPRRLVWRADEKATVDQARADPAEPRDAGGRVVYFDQDGGRRRLPADLDALSPEQRDAAISAMSQALGGGPAEAARMAAIERLTEIRAAGRMSEPDYRRERKRLEDYG